MGLFWLLSLKELGTMRVPEFIEDYALNDWLAI